VGALSALLAGEALELGCGIFRYFVFHSLSFCMSGETALRAFDDVIPNRYDVEAVIEHDHDPTLTKNPRCATITPPTIGEPLQQFGWLVGDLHRFLTVYVNHRFS